MKHYLRVELISDGSIQDTKEFSVKETERLFDALECHAMELSLNGQKTECNRVNNLRHKVRRLWERLLTERGDV